MEDGRQERRVDGYTKFWQKDASKEGEVDTSNRLDSYTDVVNGMSKSAITFWEDTSLFTTRRLLRRCHRTVRVWLGQVLPLLAVL